MFPDQRHKADQPICKQKDEDSAFCLEVMNYPKAAIDNLLKGMSAWDLKTYFSDTTEDEGSSKDHAQSSPTFENRFGEDGEESLCYSEMDVLHPQAFQDNKGVNRTIVNTEEFRQSVRVEKCK